MDQNQSSQILLSIEIINKKPDEGYQIDTLDAHFRSYDINFTISIFVNTKLTLVHGQHKHNDWLMEVGRPIMLPFVNIKLRMVEASIEKLEGIMCQHINSWYSRSSLSSTS